MKKSFLLFSLVVSLAILAGCTLQLNDAREPVVPAARTIVINEALVLTPDRSYSHAWFELYNPTGQRVWWQKSDSLTPTRQYVRSMFLKVLSKRLAYGYTFFPPDTGFVYLTPISFSPIFTVGGEIIEPGSFSFITTDSSRFRDHSNIGPGSGDWLNIPFGFRPDSLIVLFSGIPPLYEYMFYTYQPLPRGELQLVCRYDTLYMRSDSTLAIAHQREEVLDVVRFGDYRPTGVDPFPSNQPLGIIPEWSSIARYIGRPVSGNTSTDFYIEPRPTPFWHNQRAN